MNRTAIGCMAALTLIAGAHAQTFTVGVPLVDLSKSTQVIPFPFGGTLPTTGCVPNSFYNKTGGSAGLYLNSGTGTCSWALVTGGGGGGVTCAVAGGITCVGTEVAADPAVVAFISAAPGGLQSGTSPVHVVSASGSGTTYTATASPTLTAYSTNQTFWWNCDTTSTGAATINIDTLGAKPLKQANGTAIAAGTLTCPAQFPITYNGTNFYVLTAGLGGASGTTYYSQFINTGSTAMTGSDVTMATFSSVPALAAGSCFHFNGGYQGSASYQVEIRVDGTTISTPLPTGAAFGGYFYFFESEYCNDQGSQTVQTLRYRNHPTYIALASYSSPNIPQQGSYQEAPFSTPTGIDWSTPHTITVIMNSASGTGLGYFGIN